MIRAFTVCCLLSAVAGVSAAEIDPGRLAEAIRAVEQREGRDGALGERGPWQIREITWRQHMGGRSFDLARTDHWGWLCALKHIAWLRARLRAAGVDDNATNIALAWNAGLETVLQSRAPVRAYDYATRVRNLYRHNP